MESDEQVGWAKEKEVIKTSKPIYLSIWCFKHFPKFLNKFIVFCNALFFFLFNKRASEETKRFQKQLKSFYSKEKIGKISSFTQIYSFAYTIFEKLNCWAACQKEFPLEFQNDDVIPLIEQLNNGQGAFLICSHLGNSELLRYLANCQHIGLQKEVPVVMLMDLDATSNYAKTLSTLNPEFVKNLIDVNNITPESIIRMQETINSGGMVITAGDRISKAKESKYFRMPFLGKNAPFSYGVYLIAQIVKAPTYFIFALRRDDKNVDSKYIFTVQKSKIEFSGKRNNREKEMFNLCEEFKNCLEEHCLAHPFQWYNFYDFWHFPESGKLIEPFESSGLEEK